MCKQITSFNTLVTVYDLLEFRSREIASTTVQEFIALHPEDDKGLNDALLRFYALQTIFNEDHSPEDSDVYVYILLKIRAEICIRNVTSRAKSFETLYFVFYSKPYSIP